MENVIIAEFLLHLRYNFEKMELVTLPLAFGPWQIVLIVVVVLLLFGGRKIPELMRGLGSGIKEFKDASKEEKIEDAGESKTEE